jgi:hypothetical protein
MSKFKGEFEFEKRLAESTKILAKYPDMVVEMLLMSLDGSVETIKD